MPMYPTWREFLQLWREEQFTARKIDLIRMLPRLGDDGLAERAHIIGHPDDSQRLVRFRWLVIIFRRYFTRWAETRSTEDEAVCKEAFEVAARYWGILRGAQHCPPEGFIGLGLLFEALDWVIHPRYSSYFGELFRGESFLTKEPGARYLKTLLEEYSYASRKTLAWYFLALVLDPELLVKHGLKHPAVIWLAVEQLVNEASCYYKGPPKRQILPRRESLAALAVDLPLYPTLKVALLAASVQGIALNSIWLEIPAWEVPKDR